MVYSIIATYRTRYPNNFFIPQRMHTIKPCKEHEVRTLALICGLRLKGDETKAPRHHGIKQQSPATPLDRMRDEGKLV
jgi:hypothetical protein